MTDRLHTARARAIAALEEVGLGKRLHHKPNQLSGGQQQRVALARALVYQPDILLLDEPTAALGVAETEKVHELVRDLRAHGLAVVMISHNLNHVFGLADRIAVLVYGEVIAYDTPEAVRANPRVQEAYLGSVLAQHQADAAGGGH